MFLQVFADGTVIDGEGVHHVHADVLRPVVEAVASGDLARLKGHCGGPAGDFIENVHVVVFDRSLGRLRASSFSYSGNPQGCDHAVHHLQKVLDELQTKLSPATPRRFLNRQQHPGSVPPRLAHHSPAASDHDPLNRIEAEPETGRRCPPVSGHQPVIPAGPSALRRDSHDRE